MKIFKSNKSDKSDKSDKSNKTAKLRKIIKIFAIVLISLVCLAMIFHKQLGYFVTDMTIRHVSKIEGDRLEPTYDIEDVQPYSAEAAVEAALAAPHVRAAGQISIPSVGMNLPIYEGTNDVHLYLGAAESRPRSETAAGSEGNYTLASHYIAHRGSLFEPLPRVSVGDEIYVAYGSNVYKYVVDRKEQIDISDYKWLEDKGKDKIITLYTCVSLALPDARWIVQGHLEKSYDLRKASDAKVLKQFEIDETTLKGTWLETYEYLRPE